MTPEKIVGQIKTTAEDFQHFTQNEYSLHEIGSTYKDIGKRQKKLLMQLFGVETHWELMRVQQQKIKEVLLATSPEQSTYTHPVELLNLFRSDYDTAYDLGLQKDFPYTNDLSKLSMSNIEYPNIKSKERAKAMLVEEFHLENKAPQKKQTMLIVNNIMRYLEKHIEKEKLRDSLYSVDENYKDSTRPRFKEMLTECITQYVVNPRMDAKNFSTMKKVKRIYFPVEFTRQRPYKTINNILQDIVEVTKSSHGVYSVRILPKKR